MVKGTIRRGAIKEEGHDSEARRWDELEQVEFETLKDVLLESSHRKAPANVTGCTHSSKGQGGHSARMGCVTREQDKGQNSGKCRHSGVAVGTISTLRKEVRGKRRGWSSEAKGGKGFQEPVTHSRATPPR